MSSRSKKNLFSSYFFIVFLFSVVYLGLFFTPLFAEQKVLFYRGLMLLFLNFFVFLILILILKKRTDFYLYFSALVLAFSLNLCFFVVFPVTFERSVTMYLLNTLKNNNGILKLELEDKLVKEYILKNKALDKRLFEQKTTGFIEEKNNRLFLTKKGETFLKLAEIIKKLFNIK